MSAAESSSEETTGDFEAALDPVYKNIFYDVPVSNNGARNRLIICWKNIEDEFEFKNPSTLGGLKSPEFLYVALGPLALSAFAALNGSPTAPSMQKEPNWSP